MINSYKEYIYYISEDKYAHKLNFRLKDRIYEIDYEIWRFQKYLRLCEYLYNKKSYNIFLYIYKIFAAYKYRKLSLLLGFTIPTHVFGPGLRIVHRGTIVINKNAKIGKNCTINSCVNIGTKAGYTHKVPTIGDNVYIGPGAKIYGDIFIADGCAIGANSVVNKSFFEKNSIIAGIPAKLIGYREKDYRNEG